MEPSLRALSARSAVEDRDGKEARQEQRKMEKQNGYTHGRSPCHCADARVEGRDRVRGTESGRQRQRVWKKRKPGIQSAFNIDFNPISRISIFVIYFLRRRDKKNTRHPRDEKDRLGEIFESQPQCIPMSAVIDQSLIRE